MPYRGRDKGVRKTTPRYKSLLSGAVSGYQKAIAQTKQNANEEQRYVRRMQNQNPVYNEEARFVRRNQPATNAYAYQYQPPETWLQKYGGALANSYRGLIGRFGLTPEKVVAGTNQFINRNNLGGGYPGSPGYRPPAPLTYTDESRYALQGIHSFNPTLQSKPLYTNNQFYPPAYNVLLTDDPYATTQGVLESPPPPYPEGTGGGYGDYYGYGGGGGSYSYNNQFNRYRPGYAATNQQAPGAMNVKAAPQPTQRGYATQNQAARFIQYLVNWRVT